MSHFLKNINVGYVWAILWASLSVHLILAVGLKLKNCLIYTKGHFTHDHEIVRAQKKVSKDHPKKPPKSCSVVMNPQV